MTTQSPNLRPDRYEAAGSPVALETHQLLDGWARLPALITVQQAAECLGISRSAAYRAAERGDLPVIRLGGRLRVPVPRLMVMVGLLQVHETEPSERSVGRRSGVTAQSAVKS